MNEITLNLSVEETNLVLNALGAMPFAQVHQLVSKIQHQGSTQLQAAGESESAMGEKAQLD